MPGSSIHVLHVSDTHLGYRQYGLYEREQDIYNVFREVIDNAVREHVDLVIHTGDFFDSVRPPSQAILVAIEELRRLRERGIPFVAIMGDHDTPRRRVAPPLLILERLGLLRIIGLKNDVLRLTIRTRSGREVLVAGLRSHRRNEAAKLRMLLARLRKPDEDKPSILMLHQCISRVCPQYELDLTHLPQGYSYYALGHLHVYKELKVGGRPLIYPGAVDYMRVDEVRSDGGGRFIVLADIGSETTVQRIKLRRVRPQIYYELDEAQFQSKLAELVASIRRLRVNGAKPIVHLKVRGSEHNRKRIISSIERELGGLALYYRLQYETMKPSLLGSRRISDEVASIDKFELLKELLRDEGLARLAEELIDILSVKGQNPVNEAVKVIDKFYGLEG
ncbi:MAG: exonuclease SbcCD subunit D [Crenarchaeota archaeon]|nr:exonuclease SbcCD subunit D [Thermoproteota archaeon]